MYVSICNTHIHQKKLYTKEYISTMDNLEEEWVYLGRERSGEGTHMSTKPKKEKKKKKFFHLQKVCVSSHLWIHVKLKIEK